MAFEFYVAGIECEICHAISCKVDHVTTAGVYQCRSRCVGTISTCVQKLQQQQNARSSRQRTSAPLTATDYVEPLQLVTDNEAVSSTDRYYDTECSPVNNSAEDSKTTGKVIKRSFDVPATRDEHIAQSMQTCAISDRIQQQNKLYNVATMIDVTDGQHNSLSEVLLNEGHSHARQTIKLHEKEKNTNETWACSSCTFINTVTANICEMCYCLR